MSEERQCLFIVGMDVEPGKEDLFNEVYDHEHLPYMLKVPGFLGAKRYEVASDEYSPKYLAVYELESPEVLTTDAYKKGRDFGRWPDQVRPHTFNRTRGVYLSRRPD